MVLHGLSFVFHKVCWVLVLGMDLWRIGSNSTRGLLVSSFWDSVVDSDTGKNWAWKVSRKITEMRSEEKVSSLGFFQFCDSCGLYVFHRVKKKHYGHYDWCGAEPCVPLGDWRVLVTLMAHACMEEDPVPHDPEEQLLVLRFKIRTHAGLFFVPAMSRLPPFPGRYKSYKVSSRLLMRLMSRMMLWYALGIWSFFSLYSMFTTSLAVSCVKLGGATMDILPEFEPQQNF